MKPTFRHHILFAAMAIALLSLGACIDDTPPGAVAEFEVQIKMPDGFREDVYYSGKTIRLSGSRHTYFATTNQSGIAVFTGLVPDVYNLSTDTEIKAEDFISMVDSVVENNDVVLSGSIAGISIFESGSKTLQLALARRQSLLISKIYASGTKDNNNKNYIADQYFEIFNNSNDTVIIDSTYYFGLVEAESVVAFPASANPGFVYARQVFRFFPDNQQLAVMPGASVLIVNSAINHLEFSPYSVNLRAAHFEAKSSNFSNNSSVKELKLIFSAFSSLIYMNLVRGGDNGIFLLKTHENVSQFPIFYIPGKETGNRYMRIPARLISDGAETLKNKANTGPDINTKRLHAFIDAGYMNINALSGYTHESIERRVDSSRSGNGRIYLIDTNNSNNDFRTVTDPTPGLYTKPLLN